jgi:hypothetical protein
VILPGFINMHTHTKYNFQGKVDFGNRFNYRFEWRQVEYEGKYIVSEEKLLKHMCPHNTIPEDIFRMTGPEYCDIDRHKFRQNVKLYTQLQAAISGTTTIFMECGYERMRENMTYPDLIRHTIVQDVTAKNITSNDLYVIWRNEKNKESSSWKFLF